MTDRDTFAAAALTGLLAGPGDKDFSADYWARHAYEAADAMLRERERVTEPMPKEKRAEVLLTDEEREAIAFVVDASRAAPHATLRNLLERTKHDAVPEAIASPSESSVPLGNGGGCGGTDKPVTLPAMGTGDLSEAEIDALEYVVEDRPVATGMGGAMTREIGPELVARLRRFADRLEAIARGELDSPQPFAAAYAVYLNGEYDSSYGPDAIDEAMEIAADCNGDVVPLYRTPQTNATPGEGSVQGGCASPKSYQKNDEKRVLSDMKNEPVAWAILHKYHQYVSLLREQTEAHNVYVDAEIIPLYRSPTLTDEEREAVEAAIAGRLELADFATLRSLLERMK